MPAPAPLRPLALLLCAAVLAACGEATVSPPPVDVPLTPGMWYLHTANATPVPDAEIGRRFVGVVDEQTVLDSARLNALASGFYEQRYWIRVFHGGVLDRSEVVIDEGTWTEIGGVATFSSSARPRTFQVTVNAADQVTSDEPMLFFTNATNVTGVYRTTPP